LFFTIWRVLARPAGGRARDWNKKLAVVGSADLWFVQAVKAAISERNTFRRSRTLSGAAAAAERNLWFVT